MVQAAKELEMMPTTEGGLDLKLDLTHVIDGFHGNEHTLPITPLYKDVLQIFAQSGISETPTLIVNYGGPFGEDYWYEYTDVHDNAKLNHFTPHKIIDEKTKRRPAWFRKDEYAFPKLSAQVAKLERDGGLVGVGSHGQLQGLGYHWEMWMIASGGMTPMEVLRCATVNGAKIIGRPDDLGSIQPGKLADLVIMDKNPLDDIHNTNTIHWVMKNGELFEGDTLNQVWPEQKKFEPLYSGILRCAESGGAVELWGDGAAVGLRFVWARRSGVVDAACAKSADSRFLTRRKNGGLGMTRFAVVVDRNERL